jgi:glycosyltransferase involved in cell wall biosynthesis
VSRQAASVPISVVIPTLNEASNIAEAVASVSWAREVIVVDGGSTDGTEERALAAGAAILRVPGATIGAQRNAGIENSRCDWILALDADERATPVLSAQLSSMIVSPPADGARVRRLNTYLGREMRHGRFGRDWHPCVFHSTVRYDGARVHERPLGVRTWARLPGPILHTPYNSLAHHAAKLARYAEWAASDRFARGERASLVQLITKPPLRFLRDYLAYGGALDGWQGAVAAMMGGYSVFLRAALLRERASLQREGASRS